ncbi:helix-turn-helix domain-containing protein [Streptomyces sp. WMMC897]|uniref:helix-turn-helix domain-containing protein n=1 Tax=Streptomyces sp. WMMC897 TaxID=3014782 RepID=UPI0022B66437|nr:helix-turn-helix domain-containing protein [Streptomyces sp. WMMC897]MCZ7414284.1 helix-turn-helix domain-containing protein [Streptomyces sp. WMMC897]
MSPDRAARAAEAQRLAAEGMSQRAIAERLGIGATTVRRYLTPTDTAPATTAPAGAPAQRAQDGPGAPARAKVRLGGARPRAGVLRRCAARRHPPRPAPGGPHRGAPGTPAGPEGGFVLPGAAREFVELARAAQRAAAEPLAHHPNNSPYLLLALRELAPLVVEHARPHGPGDDFVIDRSVRACATALLELADAARARLDGGR